jgi:hypothetical protein
LRNQPPEQKLSNHWKENEKEKKKKKEKIT